MADSAAARKMPYGMTSIVIIEVAGVVIGGLGAVHGIYNVNQASGASLVGTESALRNFQLSYGIAEIVGSIVFGVMLYLVAGIGRAVLEMWKGEFRPSLTDAGE